MIGPLFDGFAYGMLLFLLSVGLSVTLGMMNFVNLAHCSFAMLGGYVTVTLTNQLGWPFLATLPLAFLSAALVSVVLERVLYRRLYRATDLDQCLLTIGIVFVSVAAAAYVYGTIQQSLNLPSYLRGTVSIMGQSLGVYRLFLIGMSLLVTVVLVASLEYTRFGAQVRAGLDHAFAFTYLVYVLIVVAVGGLGSIAGSFVAASLLGISDMAGKYYFPELGAFLIYLVMAGILMWRPAGLFGKR